MGKGHIAKEQAVSTPSAPCFVSGLPCGKTFGSASVMWGYLLLPELCQVGAGTWYLRVLIKTSRNATNYPGSVFYQQTCHPWHWCIGSRFPRQPQGFVCCTFCSASLFLPLVLACHSLPLSQALLSLIHSSIHVFIYVFIHVSHQLPQSEEVTAPCVL